MARFIFAFVMSLVSVTALGAETINLGPSDWRKWDPRTSHHSLEGLRTSYGQPVRLGPGTMNITRNPVIPYGSIANGMRSLVRIHPASLGASAAVTAAFMAMDWYFDNETGEWVKDMEGQEVPPLPGTGWRTGGFGSCGSDVTGKEYTSASAACDDVISCSSSNPSTSTLTKNSNRSYTCRPREGTPSGSLQISTPGIQCPVGSTLDVQGGRCLETVPVPLDGGDFSELASKLPTMPAGRIGDAAGDLQNRQGAPLPGFSDSDISGPSSVSGPSTSSTSTGPEGTITSTSTTTTNISYGPTTITTTNTTTTNTYTNGEPSGTTTTTETPSPDLVTEPSTGTGSSTSLDIPTDCEFMPTVCAFLDWFKEPIPMPEPDLPVVVDHDFEREYEMNLTAECPPPYTVDTQLFGTLSISWAPFCDLAGLMKPLVVGSAFLMSAFITLGIGRGRA